MNEWVKGVKRKYTYSELNELPGAGAVWNCHQHYQYSSHVRKELCRPAPEALHAQSVIIRRLEVALKVYICGYVGRLLDPRLHRPSYDRLFGSRSAALQLANGLLKYI